MTNKIKLLFCADDYTSFQNPHLAPLVERYFDCGVYEQGKVYDKNCLVVLNVFYPTYKRKQIIDTGIPVAVDNLWEMPQEPDGTFLQLVNPCWFWYNESIWYQFDKLDLYQPERTYRYMAFMPVNRVTKDRDMVVNKLKPYLDKFIYSYRDKHLPGDQDRNIPSWQRHFNPQWYNETCFSLVIESQFYERGFVTEKTFKPIAFQHPFMIMGQPGTLKFLKQQQFETFEELFDESYDNLAHVNRLEKIIDNLDQFNQSAYNKLTLEKLNHNRNRFFNQTLVERRLQQEIFNSMIEYVHTK